MPRKLKEFAVYKGDDFLFIGTAKECAERLGISEVVLRHYSMPSYMKRLEERGVENAMVVVNLGYEEAY